LRRRVLNSPRNPTDDVLSEFLVAASENNFDVFSDQRPIPGLRFNAPALPNIETVIDDFWSVRLECDAAMALANFEKREREGS